MEKGLAGIPIGDVEVHVSDALRGSVADESLVSALRALFGSIEPGDYFSLNAFLPFTGEGRREGVGRNSPLGCRPFGRGIVLGNWPSLPAFHWPAS